MTVRPRPSARGTHGQDPEERLEAIISEISLSKFVVLVFSSKDCHPCQELRRNLPWFSEKFGDQIYILGVDVRRHHHIAMKYGVMGVPTLFFIRDGKVLVKEAGAQNKRALKGLLKQAQDKFQPMNHDWRRLFPSR